MEKPKMPTAEELDRMFSVTAKCDNEAIIAAYHALVETIVVAEGNVKKAYSHLLATAYLQIKDLDKTHPLVQTYIEVVNVSCRMLECHGIIVRKQLCRH